MTPPPTFDASIPVLTEVIQDVPAADGVLADFAAIAVPSQSNAHAVQLEAQAIADWDAAEWSLLEHRLSERILHQLQSRVDFVLEQRIKDSMEEVLHRALRDFTSEIRIGLHDTIEKIVARAVTQELTHLQAQKK